MKTTRLWLLLGLPLALAACGGDDTEAETDVGAVTETIDTAATSAMPAAPVDTGMSAMAGADTVPLAAVGGSGVGGQAVLTDASGQSQVMVTLTGTTGTGTHQGHIHQGTCDAPGAVVAPLQPITADGSGGGSMTATVPVPMATAMNGQHVIAYHEAGGNPGSPVVCGAIPSHSM